MTFGEYCARELFTYYCRNWPEGLTIRDGMSDPDTADFQNSVALYASFANGVSRRLPEKDYAAAHEAFYALLPAVLASAVEQELGSLPPAPAEVVEAVERILAQYKSDYNAFQTADIALNSLQQQQFSRVPIVSPSLELGMGQGYTSNCVFRTTRFDVGSDPIFSSLIKAKQYGRHQKFVCIDASRIPYRPETFNTLTMVHSIDHVRDRRSVLKDMARVLAPGGTMAITDLSSHTPAFMPMADMLRAAGFPKLADASAPYYWNFHGASRELWTNEQYVKELSALGLTDVQVAYFHSPPLARLGWALFEGYLLTGRYYAADMMGKGFSKLRQRYFKFVRETMIPLIGADEHLCGRYGMGGSIFVTAKKPGVLNRSLEVPAEQICPTCHRVLQRYADGQSCDSCKLRFPSVEGLDLTIPCYAEVTEKFKAMPTQKERIRFFLKQYPRLHKAVNTLRGIGRG